MLLSVSVVLGGFILPSILERAPEVPLISSQQSITDISSYSFSQQPTSAVTVDIGQSSLV